MKKEHKTSRLLEQSIDSNNHKRILLIEDDQILSNSILSCLADIQNRFGGKIAIEMIREFHIQGAIEHLINNNEYFDALIVDLMLPRNKEDSDKLQPLNIERQRLLEEIIKKTNYSTEELDYKTARLRKQLDNLDEEIDTLIDLEGGYNILKEYAKHREEPKLTIPIIIFTARGLEEIKDKCRSIVHPKCLKWFDKPEDEMEIVKELLNFIRLENR